MTSLRYVPELLLSRVAADGGSVSAGPRADMCDGVLLFADITGFTDLMTRQSDLGRAGMEAFASSLNSYFSELIERVAAAEGDVVSFAGDALLALWRPSDDDASLEEAVRKALACGTEIQRELHRRDVGGGVRLSMRITITAGRAWFLQVGGRNEKWELFIAGDVTQQIAPALRRASPGQVVLSDEATAALSPGSKRIVIDSGPPPSRGSSNPPSEREPHTPPSRRSSNPPSEPVNIAALTPFVPQAVQFWTGREQFLGEVRAVTACFLELPDLDLTKPGTLAATDARIKTIQEIVERYEGDVNKVFADEKGLAVVLAWGLPTMSHEDDAARAVHAVRALHDTFRAEGAAPSVGLATGAVYCGLIGNDRRCEYTILGTTVNIAARLMRSARGMILCDSSTVQAARTTFDFSAPAPRALKGIVRPILASVPLGIRAARDTRPATDCIGRETELSQIEQRFHRLASEGRGAVVMVEAEAGMGKSTLLAAVIAKAKSAAFRVLFGEAQAVERRVAYHPFRTVLTEILGLRSPSHLDDAPRAIAEATDGDAWFEERAPLLSAILPVAIPETPFVAELSSDQARADNLHALVVRLIDRIAVRSPLALVLDDLHWFDSTSWALLGALVRSLPHVLFALGSRPLAEGSAAEYEILKADPSTLFLELGGLSEADLQEMVARELGVGSLPQELQKMLIERSEGNPFYAIELSLTLRDKGLLVIEEGRCKIETEDGRLDAKVLPGTIQGLVQARLDRLDADEQLFLKVASVLGRAFNVADVEAILPDRGADAVGLASRLTKADMLRAAGSPAAPSYEFRHALACDAIYGNMLLTQRRELHRAVVDHFEGRALDRERAPGILAHHASRAEDWPRAVHYLELAAEDALSRSANAECRQHIERALSIVEEGRFEAPVQRTAGWHWHASVAAFRAGTMDVCTDHGRLALAGYNMPFPKRAIMGFSEVAFAALRRARGRSKKPAGFDDLDDPTRARILELYHCLIDAFGYRLDAMGILASIMRQMELAEAVGDPGLGGHARLMLYFVLRVTPFAAKVSGWVAECEALLNEPMDARIRTSLLARLCAAHAYSGEWAEAERCGVESAHLAWENGDMRVFGEASANTYQMLHMQGRFRETEATLRRIVEVARLTGNRQFEASGVMGLADRAARLGRGAEQRGRLEEFGPWLEKSAEGADFVYGQGVRALVALLAHDRAAAVSLADACVERAARIPFPVGWMLQGLCGAGDVYETLAREAAESGADGVSALRSKLDKLVAQMRRYVKAFPFSDLFLRYYEGRAEEIAKKPARAQRTWREGLAGPHAQGLRYIRARTLQALSRSLGEGSPDAAPAQKEARTLYAELGASELRAPSQVIIMEKEAC